MPTISPFDTVCGDNRHPYSSYMVAIQSTSQIAHAESKEEQKQC